MSITEAGIVGPSHEGARRSLTLGNQCFGEIMGWIYVQGLTPETAENDPQWVDLKRTNLREKLLGLREEEVYDIMDNLASKLGTGTIRRLLVETMKLNPLDNKIYHKRGYEGEYLTILLNENTIGKFNQDKWNSIVAHLSALESIETGSFNPLGVLNTPERLKEEKQHRIIDMLKAAFQLQGLMDDTFWQYAMQKSHFVGESETDLYLTRRDGNSVVIG